MELKYRVILLSNPINALFISSKLYESKNNKLKTVIIYSPPTMAFKHLRFDLNFHKKLCLLPFKKKEKIFTYPFKNYLAKQKQKYSRKRYNFIFSKEKVNLFKFLKKNKINHKNIKELWFGWSQVKYIFFEILEDLNCHFFKFDHGLGDIRWIISDFKFSIKKFCSNLIKKFDSNDLKFPKLRYVTLFKKEINKIITTDKNQILEIKKKEMLKSINYCHDKIKKNYLLQKINLNSMIVMVDYVCLTKQKNDTNDETYIFFEELIDLLLKKLNKEIISKDIKYLIVKTKLHNSLEINKLNKILNRRFHKKIKILFFENIIKKNFNVEYCLKILNCKILISNFSFGQLIALKLFNANVEQYIFTKWYLDFWKKRKKKSLLHMDFIWVWDFFYLKYYKEFKSVLPKNI